MKKFLTLVMIGMLTVSMFANDEKALEIDSAGVVKVNNKLVNSKGVTYDPLPVGTILMYNGIDWKNNETLKGWYICDGSENTPDLRGRFVMGIDPKNIDPEKPEKDQRTGGTNEKSLKQENLPSHKHSISIDSSTKKDGQHKHEFIQHYEKGFFQGNSGALARFTPYAKDYKGNQVTGSPQYEYKSTLSSNDSVPLMEHSHKLEYEGDSGYTGVGQSFDNRPSYYGVIYIIKLQ